MASITTNETAAFKTQTDQSLWLAFNLFERAIWQMAMGETYSHFRQSSAEASEGNSHPRLSIQLVLVYY